MLMNVYLPDFVRQNTLHGGLNGCTPNARSRCGIAHIICIWYRIVAGDNDQVGPPGWPASEESDTFVCERVRPRKVLPRQRQDRMWDANREVYIKALK